MIGPAELEDIRLDLEAARLEREAAITAAKLANANESGASLPLDQRRVRIPAAPI